MIRLLPSEQSDLGPYCLQYRLPKNISRREEQKIKGLMIFIHLNIFGLNSELLTSDKFFCGISSGSSLFAKVLIYRLPVN